MDRGYWSSFPFGIFAGQEGFHAFHDGKLAAEEALPFIMEGMKLFPHCNPQHEFLAG
jgi:hypothetical protein